MTKGKLWMRIMEKLLPVYIWFKLQFRSALFESVVWIIFAAVVFGGIALVKYILAFGTKV